MTEPLQTTNLPVENGNQPNPPPLVNPYPPTPIPLIARRLVLVDAAKFQALAAVTLQSVLDLQTDDNFDKAWKAVTAASALANSSEPDWYQLTDGSVIKRT